MLKVVSVDEKGNETDITADVTFGEDGAATPKSVYADTETYYVGTVDAYYKGVKLDAAPTVYIGVKGDADLDGTVGLEDATLALTYYSEHAVSNAYYFTTSSATAPENVELETLAYFLADINTESTAGADSADFVIELADATNILTYYAEDAVKNEPKWAAICDELANHPIWGAQIG
ncbi:putative cellulose-binding protein [Ruminococcus sp. CAG:403]|nr:putative cellulose-binding protein [Ruminococcus sp. CAG:403]